MRKATLATVLITSFLLFVGATIAQEDLTPPVTIKTYGDSSTPGVYNIPSCEGTVPVNVHFISTSTTITLAATDEDEGSGVNSTWYTVLVPAECEAGDIVEYVGLEDSNIYESSEQCAFAVDDPETEESETQECVPSWWDFKEELIGPLEETLEGFIQYQEPFVIPQESVHKICYLSSDNAENWELPFKCQVAVVDDNPPTIYSAEVDHQIIDLEYFSGQIGYFDDPKCTFFEINASDTHGIDDAQVNVEDALLAMFYPQVTDLPSFYQSAWDNYLAQEMHNMPAAYFDSEAGLYKYQFCAGEHLYHLYDMEVISWDDLKKLVSEELVLGEFAFPILVNDTAGHESQTSVNLTITDLTVPLEEGWNLRSTPIRLEGDKFWSSGNIDTILRWDSASQLWQLVTDNSISPLDALYIHATERNQIGYIFERDLTSPPVRQLDTQWNLVGPANQLSDSLQSPCSSNSDWSYDYHYDYEGYYHYDWHYDYYKYYYGSGESDWYWEWGWHNGDYLWLEEVCDQYLTYLWDQYTYIGQAFGSLVYDANGNRALDVVISPQQYLSYSDNWGSWYFNQDSFVWIPQIEEQGADPENYWEQTVRNFGGYWVFMQNSDLLPGFTTTPLPLSGGD